MEKQLLEKWNGTEVTLVWSDGSVRREKSLGNTRHTAYEPVLVGSRYENFSTAQDAWSWLQKQSEADWPRAFFCTGSTGHNGPQMNLENLWQKPYRPPSPWD